VLAMLPGTKPDPAYNPSATSQGPPTVFTADGTVYTFPQFNHSLATSSQRFGLPSTIEDRNGNVINVTDNGGGSFSVKDTAGRNVISSNGFGSSGTTNTLSVGGLTYQVVWTTTTANFPAPPRQWAGESGEPNEYDECFGVPAGSTTQTVVSEIILPNGQTYQFFYGTNNSNPAFQNPYGLLNRIVYPDGGWVQYSWKWADQMNELADYPGSYEVACGDNYCVAPVIDGCLYQYATPVVNQRQVGFTSSSAPSLTQSFTYDTSWGTATAWATKTTTVSTQDNIRGDSQTTSYTYWPIAAPTNDPLYQSGFPPAIPVEHTILYYDFSGSLLKTVTKNWNNQYQLASEQEQWPTGLTSQTTYAYTPQFSLVTTKSEYDNGQGSPGPLLRQTVTTYQGFSGTPGIIADAPCKTVTYDGNSNRYAETDYLYDGSTTLCSTETSAVTTSPVTVVAGTHDEASFGPSNTTPRGNVTQKTRWASTGTSPVTTYTYDETGQALTMTDPCGNPSGICSDMTGSNHTTTYSYADSYTVLSSGSNSSYTPSGGATNTYLTKITDPLGHIETFQYDYYSGQLTKLTDPNGQTSGLSTTYIYNDLFDRPTQVNYPDGGQTEYSYNDAPPSPTVTTCQLINGTAGAKCGPQTNGWKTSVTTMDGVGHAVQTQLLSDPDGPTFTATNYDGFGRVFTQSNPYRSTSDPTYGITTNIYDALGRTFLVQRPDGSSVQKAYDQTCSVSANGLGTTVTDETGKLRESCTDGLGRLIEVDEPGAGAGNRSPSTATVSINENSSEVSNTFQVCEPSCQNETAYNSGTITLTVEGVAYSTTYGPPPPTGPYTTSYIASALASQFNGDVTAVANGSTITLTSATTGTDTNYSLSITTTYNTANDCPNVACFSGPSFYASGPTALTGGSNPGLGTSPLVTQYVYDPLNDLTCAVQKGTDTTAFSTCAAASATWRPRSFVYDSLSRLTSSTNPESRTITYTYDPNGNMAQRVTPAVGQTGTAKTTHIYTYDVENRLLQESHAYASDGLDKYAYDGSASLTSCGQNPPSITATNLVHRRSQMCGSNSGSSWSYDSMGRPLLESTTNRGSAQIKLSIQYLYNKDGSLSQLTYPSGDVVTYTVGNAGRVTQVADSANTFVAAPTGLPMYAPHGAVANMTSAGVGSSAGIVISNSYNDRLQPYILSASPASGSAIFSLCYDFHLHVAINNSNPNDQACDFPAYTTGNNGNVFQAINNVSPNYSAVYAYDSLNRIAQANTVNTTSSNCWGETYTIDNWGNLTNRGAPSGMSGSCTTESLSATATTHNQLSGIGMAYDAAGNLTTDNLGNPYTYDAENRISTAAGYTYYYDADGARMEKTSGSSGTMYWFGPSGTLTETNLAGTITEEYIYFNGERIARVDRPSATVHYYFSDQLASASVIASPTTVVQERYFYYPYGGMISSIGSDPNNYKFTGKERDSESGLDNFGARFYTSSIGRFMTPDWAARATTVPYAVFGDPQTLNLYSYVENGPINRADADGHGADGNYFQNHDSDCAPGGANGCYGISLSQAVGLDQSDSNAAALAQYQANAPSVYVGEVAQNQTQDQTQHDQPQAASAGVMALPALGRALAGAEGGWRSGRRRRNRC
jgi:RHS repeat-associated protein